MIAENRDDVKTPNGEALRLNALIERMEVGGIIDKYRACALYERILRACQTQNDDLAVFAKLDAIENVLTCRVCNGTGVQTITDGVDVGERFVATRTIKCRCKCCGG